jgi:magnesium transporter
MTIVAARRYDAGKPVPVDIAVDGRAREPLAEGCFEWVGLYNPTEDEMARAGAQYSLHPLAVEDALTTEQAPKVDTYESQTFIVARTAEFVDVREDRLAFGQTAIFVGADFLVTVRFGSVRAHDELRAKLEKDPEHLSKGPDYVAHALLDFIVDGYGPIVDRVEQRVEELEEQLIAQFPEPETIRRIFSLRRELRRLGYFVGPMEEVCRKLSKEHLPAIDRNVRVWFRDVYDHIRRTMLHLRGLNDTLANIVETGAMLEQHRQGEITRQLAAWAAIIAVPTAIAGVYGMNFEFIPELHWRFGYPLVVGGMASICTGLWLQFRRIGWL